jgi:hypothetical protein
MDDFLNYISLDAVPQEEDLCSCGPCAVLYLQGHCTCFAVCFALCMP